MADVNVEIDGRPIAVPAHSTVLEAAHRLGIYVPHFCYHKKLSIAANCRMCLVQVEKVPKPLPACATPVTEGMKVYTHSEVAVRAQEGVMEFLLINHPLDCPICDQGGECQLQDLAVGYGGSASRYTEPKRVVAAKDIGPLVAAEEMTRCIHCTRCVRFGREIGGVMELGMAGRGEHAEILSFLGQGVDSELSGNMIDLCPVGALTSKPFRFAARAWELSRRRSVSPHDGLGSNLIVQAKQDRVMRVLPLEDEEINECWLSDKDRFSYEALNSPERLTRPMVRRGEEWEEVEWPIALEEVALRLKRVREQHGGQTIGALATPHSTLEELYLLGKLTRALGGSADFRLRQSDFSADGKLPGVPWLGMRIAEISALKRVLLIGSQVRKEHPLIAARLRQAVRKGAQVSVLHCLDDDQLIKLHAKVVVAPAEMAKELARLVRASAQVKGIAVPDGARSLAAEPESRGPLWNIAESLCSDANAALFLGNLAQHHPQGSTLHWLAHELAQVTSSRIGFLGEAANSVGGYLAGAVPASDPPGMNAREMLAQPRRAYVLWNTEVELDCHNPRQALAAMRAADVVVALSPFRHRAVEYAHVLLPIGPFTETAGTFVSTEGRVQSFAGVVRPLLEARPGWKVLRVLGNLLGVPGFEFGSADEVKAEALKRLDLTARLSNLPAAVAPVPAIAAGVQRIAEVPIYFADALARRSEPLQMTRDAAPPSVRMSAALADRLGVEEGDYVRIAQDGGEATLPVVLDPSVPAGCVRIAAAHPLTARLGDMFGSVTLERIPVAEKAMA